MAKPNIKKLGYPLWFNIVFLCLTVGGPIVLVVMEGLSSPSSAFRWTFMTVATALTAWVFIQHFLVKNLRKKLLAKQTALEHDYSIDVGNSNKIKYLWYTNEQWLTLFTLINGALFGGLVAVIMTGVASGLMHIRGTILLIAIFYVIAYTLKFMATTLLKGVDNYGETSGPTGTGGG